MKENEDKRKNELIEKVGFSLDEGALFCIQTLEEMEMIGIAGGKTPDVSPGPHWAGSNCNCWPPQSNK